MRIFQRLNAQALEHLLDAIPVIIIKASKNNFKTSKKKNRLRTIKTYFLNHLKLVFSSFEILFFFGYKLDVSFSIFFNVLFG